MNKKDFLSVAQRQTELRKWKPVIRSDGKQYPSISATKTDGFHPTGVYKVCAGLMNTHKGFGWEYDATRKPTKT